MHAPGHGRILTNRKGCQRTNDTDKGSRRIKTRKGTVPRSSTKRTEIASCDEGIDGTVCKKRTTGSRGRTAAESTNKRRTSRGAPTQTTTDAESSSVSADERTNGKIFTEGVNGWPDTQGRYYWKC